MITSSLHRPEWEIDKQLRSLVGENIRVAAESFSPHCWNGKPFKNLTRSADLILPDNSQPSGVPVLFEGRLQRFGRQVGVVFVELGSASLPYSPAQGFVPFRGRMAVILSGPATVKLSVPLLIERVPKTHDNYWHDLRFPRAQLQLDLFPGNDV